MRIQSHPAGDLLTISGCLLTLRIFPFFLHTSARETAVLDRNTGGRFVSSFHWPHLWSQSKILRPVNEYKRIQKVNWPPKSNTQLCSPKTIYARPLRGRGFELDSSLRTCRKSKHGVRRIFANRLPAIGSTLQSITLRVPTARTDLPHQQTKKKKKKTTAFTYHLQDRRPTVFLILQRSTTVAATAGQT